MNDVSKIWYKLNEAVQGRVPVYEIACRCVGLPSETIDELCDKMMADLHIKPSTYDLWIKQQKIREVVNK
jgi:hypothetical protein